MTRVFIPVVIAVALAGCESIPSDTRPMRQPTSPTSVFLVNADPSFRLKDQERIALPPTLNPNAVERLMAWVRPELRANALEDLAQLGDPRISIAEISISFPHPEIASILKELRREPVRDHNDGRRSPPNGVGTP